MEHEPGLQWLAGMEVVNHHTLSDFRVAHGSAMQNLMEQVLGVLFSEGLVGLERVTQDGTKIRAQAEYGNVCRFKFRSVSWLAR